MSTYFLINLAALSIPLLFSFHPKFPFVKHWNSFLKACFITSVPFLLWDAIFTRIGVWGFNALHIYGSGLLGMPWEEFLFFFCIPYACVFTFYGLEILLRDHSRLKYLDERSRWVYLGLGVVLIPLGVMFSDLSYTSVTFLSMGSFGLILYRKNPPHLFLTLATYILTLVPFFLVNGMLTGSWISQEVVWYNDTENLSLRMGTIPIEDAFYGMLLIMMNITLFIYFRGKRGAL